ncbi:MAG: ankyrin repeat domain-containing protein [Proteobacteria bacterium]|nr:ankyrin repeat domain-containing protein [Pseudomonadota bacterium]
MTVIFKNNQPTENAFLDDDIIVDYYETQKEEFLTYNDLFKTDDIIPNINSVEEIKQLELELENSPTETGETKQREGITVANKVQHKPFALHYAAKNGDLNEIKRLVLTQGYDVNQEGDLLSSRPLYIASLFGHVEAARFFIRHGSEVHDDSYMGETALHAALYKKHYALARVLVEEGKALVNLINMKNETPMKIVIDQFLMIMKDSHIASSPSGLSEMNELVKTIDVFSTHCGQHCLYSIFVNNKTQDIPVGCYLRLFASRVPSTELRNKLISLADEIAKFDPSEKIYNNAKNLLNTFPIENIYELKFSENKTTLFQPHGHFSYSTTQWALTSLKAYYNHLLHHSASDSTKLSVFAKLIDIFEAANELKAHGGIEAYAQAALERYQNNETVLLASGWSSHFIDVVISKQPGHELFITGNTGVRFQEISPGLTFYHLNNPDKINAKFMHDMVMNIDRTYFEQDVMYEYELIEKVGEKIKPLQEHSNCTWVGHQHGIEASLYIELLNQGLPKDDAGLMASKYAKDWEQFHSVFQIESYMKEGKTLEINALTDILIDISEKQLKNNSDIHPELTHKIRQALTSTHYLPSFKAWLSDPAHEENALVVKKLFEHAGAVLPSQEDQGNGEQGHAGGGFIDFITNGLTKIFKSSDDFQDTTIHGFDSYANDSSQRLIPQHDSLLVFDPPPV